MIPTSVTSLGSGVFEYCSLLASVTLPGSVTSLGSDMFFSCSSLTSLTVPDSVTNIGSYAFLTCPGLTSVYFKGNAPVADSTVFSGDNVKIYYLPGTAGWGTFATATGQAPVLWNPQAQTGDGGFGVRTNRFGFNLNGSANIVVVVEACTNFFNPVWQPEQTNTLMGGMAYFSDPQWTNYPNRFYRLRSP